MVAIKNILLISLGVATLLGILVACSPLKAINVLTPEDTYNKTADISYGSDQRQKLDVYVPLNFKNNQQGKSPVAVFFYGGNWNSGSRESYAFVGEAFASRGIVTVIVDYRLYPQVRYPDFLDDSAQAVAWALKHIAQYGGDPARLYVVGHSAGAYNAAMVALDPRWLGKFGASPAALRGWVGLAGPYNFIPIENKDTRPVFWFPNTPTESQPINHVSSASPATLLIASNKDDLVNPQRNTGALAAKLKAAGVATEVVYFDSTSHTTLLGAISRPLRGIAPVLDKVEAFINGRR